MLNIKLKKNGDTVTCMNYLIRKQNVTTAKLLCQKLQDYQTNVFVVVDKIFKIIRGCAISSVKYVDLY